MAMPTFEAVTTIAAPANRVWQTLLRTDRWPSWDPALRQVDGVLAANGRLTIRVKEVSRPFRLRVREWDPQRRIVLTAGMPLGLFTGTRDYRLEPHGDRTRFILTERYTGPLVAVVARTIPDLQPSFEAFVTGLRHEVEHRAPPMTDPITPPSVRSDP